MKQFLLQVLKFSLIGIIPIVLLLIGYCIFDPFQVLKDYNDYSYAHVISNRDYISTTMFLKHRDKQRYDSFIFGSSRTLAYQSDAWLKHLPANSKPFAFDASCESIDGIYDKLKYLDSTHAPIKNVLIIVCRDVTFSPTKPHTGHLFTRHPATSGKGYITFHLSFIKAYFDPKFLFNFYSYKIIGKYKPFMAGFIDNRVTKYDTLTNQINIIDQENEIARNADQYYRKRRDIFYTRKGEQTDSVRRITPHDRIVIQKIRNIFDKNHTRYKVVISPLYEQVKFSNADLTLLKQTFGKQLFDFSGKNKYTDLKTNYYEKSHYRTRVGDSILKHIYR